MPHVQRRVRLALLTASDAITIQSKQFLSSTMPPIQMPHETHARSRSSVAQRPSSKCINLSSDTLELSSPDVHFRVPPRRRKPLITKAKHKPKPKAPIDDKDVIEISSDEGEVPLSQECIVANLRRQVKSRTHVCLYCYPLSPHLSSPTLGEGQV